MVARAVRGPKSSAALGDAVNATGVAIKHADAHILHAGIESAGTVSICDCALISVNHRNMQKHSGRRIKSAIKDRCESRSGKDTVW